MIPSSAPIYCMPGQTETSTRPESLKLSLDEQPAPRSENQNPPQPNADPPSKPALDISPAGTSSSSSASLDRRHPKRILLIKIAGATLISGLLPACFHFWIASGAATALPVRTIPLAQKLPLGPAPDQTDLPSTPGKPQEVLREKTTDLESKGIQTQQAAKRPEPPPPHDAPSISKPREDLDLSRITREAYEAYQAGRLEEARQHYAAAATLAPFDVSTLNALGLISLRLGLREDAEHHWQAARQLDLANAEANAHLSVLRSESGKSGLEEFLHAQLANRPEAAPILFALGYLYAQQHRWSEAQQMFFEAHAHAPENPDAAYNLAVALDHLGQAGSAAHFYLLAHAASATNPVAFDIDHAAKRAETLLAPTTPTIHAQP